MMVKRSDMVELLEALGIWSFNRGNRRFLQEKAAALAVDMELEVDSSHKNHRNLNRLLRFIRKNDGEVDIVDEESAMFDNEAVLDISERTPEEWKPCYRGNPGQLKAAEIVLRESETPLTIPQIQQRIEERGLWYPPNEGKTPCITLRSYITRQINRLGESSRFVRVKRGLYTLRERDGHVGVKSEEE